MHVCICWKKWSHYSVHAMIWQRCRSHQRGEWEREREWRRKRAGVGDRSYTIWIKAWVELTHPVQYCLSQKDNKPHHCWQITHFKTWGHCLVTHIIRDMWQTWSKCSEKLTEAEVTARRFHAGKMGLWNKGFRSKTEINHSLEKSPNT